MSDYDVVLLVEQELSAQDAVQVRGLHDEIEDPVRYFVLVPVKENAALIEPGLGSLGLGDAVGAASLAMDPETVQEMQHELLDECRECVSASVARIVEAGGQAVGELVTTDPIQALAAKVTEVDAREVVILTRPHVVAEFFHLDWTSRARRKLGVPVLHLLEHENFDEQAGEGEGISGF
jgi:hypothetical protein